MTKPIPHLVPLSVALDLIYAAVAVQIDGSYVTYPSDPDGHGEDDSNPLCLVCAPIVDMDDEDMDRFRTADNTMVEATAEGFVMVDTRGERTLVMPLMAAPLRPLVAFPEPRP